MRVGFIGQGYVGKNYADDFENRGYEVVRYSLEKEYLANKDTVGECDIVLIAVPTPTTPQGFDLSIVESALGLVRAGRIAVIKSTILPGSTTALQDKYPQITVLFSPEFLRESTAARDTAHPFSVIVGLPVDDAQHREAADALLSVLPDAPSKLVMSSTEAEMVKYAQNAIGYVDIVAFNVFYDLSRRLGADWQNIRKALDADPDISSRFANPVHKSGRGAGGHCLIKDFAALRELYEKLLPEDETGLSMIHAIERKNVALLAGSGKDPELLRAVYGDPASFIEPRSTN